MTLSQEHPGFGRPSAASATEPVLAASGDAGVAGWRAEAASTDWCSLRAASVVGVRHRLAGRRSDDCFAWGHDGSRLAVAVADGLGSVSDSCHAAARASLAAVNAAVACPGDDPAAAAGAGISAANLAAEGGGATTLVIAVFDRPGGGVVARVGDSTAFMVDQDGSWQELFDGPDPDRAGSATSALPAEAPGPEVVPAVLREGSVVVLATDGVADPWRDGPSTVAPSMAQAVVSKPSALELLGVADFSRHGCHDDRTVVCLWRRGADGS